MVGVAVGDDLAGAGLDFGHRREVGVALQESCTRVGLVCLRVLGLAHRRNGDRQLDGRVGEGLLVGLGEKGGGVDGGVEG